MTFSKNENDKSFSHAARQGRRGLVLAVLASGMMLFSMAQAGWASNIFDDGWEPAKRATEKTPVKTPPAVVPTPPEVKNPPVNLPEVKNPPVEVVKNPPATVPATQVVTPVTPVAPATPATVAAPKKKFTRPEVGALAEARKVMREVFAKEIANKAVAVRVDFATKLLGEASKCEDKPVDSYALLAGAYEAGLDGKSLLMSCRAADSMGRLFSDVDAAAMKSDAAGKILASSAGADLDMENILVAAMMLDGVIAAEDYLGAVKMGQQMSQLTTRLSPGLRTLVQKKSKDAEAIRLQFLRAMTFNEQLQKDPESKGANFEVGTFLSFWRGEWERGLPMLARGSDAKLAELAAKDLATPANNNADILRMADAWWSYAEGAKDRMAAGGRERATFWYKKIADADSGLRKMQIAKRIQDGQPVIPMDQLPAPEAVGGAWKIVGRELQQSDGGKPRLIFGDPNWSNYNFQYSMRIDAGSPGTELQTVLHVADAAALENNCISIFLGGWSNTQHAYFVHVGGIAKATAKYRGSTDRNVWYTVRVEVRESKVRYFIEGRLLLELDAGPELMKGRIAVGTYNTHGSFRNLAVTSADDTQLLWFGLPDASAK